MRSITAPNPNLRVGICVGLGERLRIPTGDQQPDCSTIAAFRRRHRAAPAQLLVATVELPAAGGLVGYGMWLSGARSSRPYASAGATVAPARLSSASARSPSPGSTSTARQAAGSTVTAKPALSPSKAVARTQ